MINFGPVPAGSVLPVYFSTYGKTNGESITLTGLAVTDVEIYKGTSITQRSSDAGYALIDTDGIDVDGITGIHAFSIDTGDNTDSGFFAAGSFYTVVVSAVTIDSQTVNFIAATFRIVAAENTAGTPVADTVRVGGTAQTARDIGASVLLSSGTGTGQVTLTSGRVNADLTHIATAAVSTSTAQLGVNVVQAAGTAWGSGAITAASIASDAITAAKVADGAIDAATFAAGAINAAAIASDAITAAKIADGAIDAATFAAGAINAAAIASDAITDAKVASDVTIASVTGAVGSVTGNVGGNVTGSIGSLATQAKADVNAEVLDVLNTDTFAEPGQGAPAATATLAAKINYLYKAWRNKKTQTSTTWSLFADDASTVDQKSTVSDDGSTATRGEIATGP